MPHHLYPAESIRIAICIQQNVLTPKPAKVEKTLAEEFLRIWAENRDPNSGRNRSYKYGYMYGYNQRANSIPLTRSKQERNLTELAKWTKKLQALPTEKLDQSKLTEAFTKIHSRAEVYKPEAINKIFGNFKDMDAKTVAAIAATMRTNLATVWRNPKTQQDLKTKRKDAEILAEIRRGYASAMSILLESLQSHPNNWRIWTVRACHERVRAFFLRGVNL